MRTSFTPDEVREMTARDLATLRTEYADVRDDQWVDRMSHIIEDLHTLSCQPQRDPAAIDELEKRVTAFLAEDKRNKGMTPYLYMARSLRTGGTPHI
jgi:hypothetical protein